MIRTRVKIHLKWLLIAIVATLILQSGWLFFVNPPSYHDGDWYCATPGGDTPCASEGARDNWLQAVKSTAFMSFFVVNIYTVGTGFFLPVVIIYLIGSRWELKKRAAELTRNMV